MECNISENEKLSKKIQKKLEGGKPVFQERYKNLFWKLLHFKKPNKVSPKICTFITFLQRGHYYERKVK